MLRPVLATFVLAALLTLFSGESRADTTMLYGVPFEFDRATPVEGSLVRLKIGEHEVIVSRAESEFEVARYTLRDLARIAKFKPAELVSFIEGAAVAQRAELAGLGTVALTRRIENEKVSDAECNAWGAQVDRSLAGLAESYRAELSKAIMDDIARAPVNVTSVCGTELLMLLGSRLSTFTREPIVQALRADYKFVEEAAPKALSKRLGINAVDARMLRDMIAEVLGPTHPLVERWSVNVAKAESIFRGLPSASGNEIRTYFTLLRSDPDLARAIGGALAAAVRARSLDQFNAGKPDVALDLLALIPAPFLTSDTADVADKILENPGPRLAPALALPHVASFFADYGRERPELLEQALLVYGEEVAATAESGEIAKSEILLSALLRMRPDPSFANDYLRLRQVKAYEALGNTDSSLEKLVEIRSWWNPKIAALYIWWYAHLAPTTSGLLLVALALALGFAVVNTTRRRRQLQARRPQNITSAKTDDVVEQNELPKFVSATPRAAPTLDPEYQEYVNCLRVFRLQPGADTAKIKTAYRNAVKEYHPDRHNQSGSGAMASEVFIEITRTYERLLKLHKRCGKHAPPPPQ